MDTRSKVDRSENMRRITSKDTNPELTVRRLIHSLNYRYRLHYSSLPGRPDIVFPGRKKVIFIHGCFWHKHAKCKIAHRPKSNNDYWNQKLRLNKQRDRKNLRLLSKMGWQSLVIWECEIKKIHKIKVTIKRFLDPTMDHNHTEN